MNKGITIFILVVLLCAMGMIFYSHIQDRDPEPLGPQYTAGPAPHMNVPPGHNATAGDDAAEPAGQPPLADKTPAEAPQTREPAAQAGQNASSTPPATDADAPSGAAATGKTDAQPVKADNTTQPVKADNATQPAKADSAAPPVKADAGAITSSQLDGQATPAATTTAPSGAHTLKNIGVHFSGQNMMLRIESDSVFPIKHFVLAKPDRLVIDLPGNWKNMRVPNVPQNNIIKAVRLGSQPAGPRLVLDLAKTPTHQEVVKVSDTVVEILVR